MKYLNFEKILIIRKNVQRYPKLKDLKISKMAINVFLTLFELLLAKIWKFAEFFCSSGKASLGCE